MADEQTELSDWEKEELAKQDAVDRRRINVELEEVEKRNAAKRAKNLGSMSDDELRRHTRQWGFEAI
jgi:hypothetical protein